MIVNEGDELLMWCGYCGGRAVKADFGWEHADAGERITNISPGDFVSGSHNVAGTRIGAYDLLDADEIEDERLTAVKVGCGSAHFGDHGVISPCKDPECAAIV